MLWLAQGVFRSVSFHNSKFLCTTSLSSGTHFFNFLLAEHYRSVLSIEQYNVRIGNLANCEDIINASHASNARQCNQWKSHNACYSRTKQISCSSKVPLILSLHADNDDQYEKMMMKMTIGMKNDENDNQEGRAERGNEDGYVCFPWM